MIDRWRLVNAAHANGQDRGLQYGTRIADCKILVTMSAAAPAGGNVWIVGNPEVGAHASTHRYHRADCYVLDQVGNRGRTTKIPFTELPDGYAACQICAPGPRLSGAVAAEESSKKTRQKPIGVQPGRVAEIEDLDTGRVATHRIVPSGQRRQPGEVSAGSPLGVALIGQEAGAAVEFTTPTGARRRLRILRIE